MSFLHAVRTVLRKYATFSGRARRSEYWWFSLFSVICGFVTAGIDTLLDTVFDNTVGVVGLVGGLALLLPSWAVTVRRLHDTGRTGWWALLPVALTLTLVAAAFTAFVMFVFSAFSGDGDGGGSLTGLVVVGVMVLLLLTLASYIVLLVFMCQDSQAGPNRYGPSPKEPLPPAGPTFGGPQPASYGPQGWGTPPAQW